MPRLGFGKLKVNFFTYKNSTPDLMPKFGAYPRSRAKIRGGPQISCQNSGRTPDLVPKFGADPRSRAKIWGGPYIYFAFVYLYFFQNTYMLQHILFSEICKHYIEENSNGTGRVRMLLH